MKRTRSFNNFIYVITLVIAFMTVYVATVFVFAKTVAAEEERCEPYFSTKAEWPEFKGTGSIKSPKGEESHFEINSEGERIAIYAKAILADGNVFETQKTYSRYNFQKYISNMIFLPINGLVGGEFYGFINPIEFGIPIEEECPCVVHIFYNCTPEGFISAGGVLG